MYQPSNLLLILGAVFVLGLLGILAFTGPDATEQAPAPTTLVPQISGLGTTEASRPEPPSASEASSSSAEVIVDEGVVLPELLSQVVELWRTDWTRRTIDSLDELLIGIPVSDPRDVIRPIDDPRFESTVEADAWLEDREPGLLLDIEGDTRFYPLQIMNRHEIVNDVVGGVPVAITYCPLCNTGIVFERELDGQIHRFGVSGLLRNSDLVMWDELTHSLWQQITGEAIVGQLAGTTLVGVGSQLVRWGDFKSTFSDGKVLSEDTGLGSTYGINPYEYYSSRDRPYAFYQGEIDPRFPALSRVVGVNVNDAAKAYPFGVIADERAVNDVVAGVPIAVFWGAEDTADALDGVNLAAGRAVGTGVAYLRTVNDVELTFTSIGDTFFRDDQTGTTWNILGMGLEGPLEGQQLEPLVQRNEFWFAWQAFFPEAPVYGTD